MSKKTVSVGQVYKTVNVSYSRTWRVVGTLPMFGIQHALLVSTEDAGEKKTLSWHILTDPAYFMLVDTVSGSANAA